MAFVLGELNKASPNPRIKRQAIIKCVIVFSLSVESIIKLTVVNNIPKEATTLGSILSDNIPAIGAKSAIVIG